MLHEIFDVFSGRTEINKKYILTKLSKDKGNEDHSEEILDETVINIFPKNFIIKEEFIPIKLNNNVLTLLTYKKLDSNTIEKIKDDYGFTIKEKFISYTTYCEKIKTFKENLNNDPKASEELFHYIIKKALSEKASDIHIEPCSDICNIRFRINGVLSLFQHISIKSYKEILSIVKIKSNMDISKKLIPQDGSMTYYFMGYKYNLRTSTLPSIYKENLVIRILNPKQDIDLYNLGFSENLDELKNIAYKNKGIFLVSGPTGSGKSTTLKAIINSIDKDSKNIITIEDPVEYKLQGVTQVNLNKKVNLGFNEALKSIVRQDPDVIMIGEIRDEETATTALRAAITGHLVLSTVHTYDSTSVVTRLLDMKIPPYILLDGLSMVLSQRLVRELCPHCKKKYSLKKGEYEELNLHEGDIIYKSVGCEKCNKTGYIGRKIVYEFLNLNQSHKRYISNNKDLSGFREFCIKNGLITLKNKCLKMLYDGTTTVEEVFKVIL